MNAPALIPPPDGHAWPPGTSWAWRPGLSGGRVDAPNAVPPGTEIVAGVKVFHEGAAEAVRLRPADPAGLRLEALAGAGSFLSLVIDMPEAGLGHLDRRRIVSLAGCGALEGGGGLHARINLRHGPNVAQQTRPATLDAGRLLAEFDLAYSDLGHAPVTQVWVDLLLSDPAGAALTVTDIALAHRPRAEM